MILEMILEMIMIFDDSTDDFTVGVTDRTALENA